MSLLDLPPELNLRIVDFLDPDSVLRLSKTNARLFYLLRTRKRMTEILWFFEFWHPLLFDRGRDLYPCYGCLQACHRNDLVGNGDVAIYGNPVHCQHHAKSCNVARPLCLGGKKGRSRRCKECYARNGR